MNDIEVLKVCENDKRSLFNIVTQNGFLVSQLNNDTNWYVINSIDSRKPRTGIGKLLLKTCLTHAESLQATAIRGYITSPECISSAITIFGEESVHVVNPGTFGEAWSADALLHHPLNC